jgi:hypothetical protein
MIDMSELVASWASRINRSDVAKELAGIMFSIPKPEREKLLAAVASQNESSLKFCADSIVSCSTAIYKDGLRHLARTTDSLLAMAPFLAPTYDSFCPANSRTHEHLAVGAFNKVLSSLCLEYDLPSDFLFDHARESRFLPEMHGIMIAALAGDTAGNLDLEWLGNNRALLAPYADTLYEHGRVDREFCERLINLKSPSLSTGNL